MKKYVWVICILIVFVLSACKSPQGEVDDSVPEVHNQSGKGVAQAVKPTEGTVDMQEWKNQFAVEYNLSEAEIADQYLEKLIGLVEDSDHVSLKELFSESKLTLVDNIDDQIDKLMHFYQGEMISYERYGPISRYGKEGGHLFGIIRGSYDIETSEGIYRISFKVCINDTEAPGEIGLHSLHIIKAEDSNMEFAYWCSSDAAPGITIEEGDETERNTESCENNVTIPLS